MRELNLALTGLDRSYMQKLALYAHNRMKGRIRMQIYDGELPEGVRKDLENGSLLLGGPESVLLKDPEAHLPESGLVIFVDEPERAGRNRVCGWQPADRVFQDILKIWMSGQKDLRTEEAGDPAEWYVILSDGSMGETLPYGLAFADQIGRDRQCLFLDLTGHLGWRRLFELEEGPDLADLILELRQGGEGRLNDYVREIAGVELILPPQNPMVFPELSTGDLQRFRRALHQSGLYTQIVVLAGPMLPILPELCAHARSLICLYRKGSAGSSVRDEWYDFIRKTGNRGENWMELAVSPERIPDCSGQGPHVAEAWLHGGPGRQMQNLTERIRSGTEGKEEHGRT